MTRAAIAHGDVTSPQVTARFTKRNFNVFNLATYEEVEARGLDRYFDRQTWERHREEMTAYAS